MYRFLFANVVLKRCVATIGMCVCVSSGTYEERVVLPDWSIHRVIRGRLESGIVGAL